MQVVGSGLPTPFLKLKIGMRKGRTTNSEPAAADIWTRRVSKMRGYTNPSKMLSTTGPALKVPEVLKSATPWAVTFFIFKLLSGWWALKSLAFTHDDAWRSHLGFQAWGYWIYWVSEPVFRGSFLFIYKSGISEFMINKRHATLQAQWVRGAVSDGAF